MQSKLVLSNICRQFIVKRCFSDIKKSRELIFPYNKALTGCTNDKSSINNDHLSDKSEVEQSDTMDFLLRDKNVERKTVFEGFGSNIETLERVEEGMENGERSDISRYNTDKKSFPKINKLK